MNERPGSKISMNQHKLSANCRLYHRQLDLFHFLRISQNYHDLDD